ncbi:MAG: hypothetical protein K0R40_2731 [Burkholderiales bacterium]|nr:hypothetical protein [Burkholderiales bacterium]
MPPQEPEPAAQPGKREGREDQRCDQPTQEVERQRVERIAQRAAGDPVSRPQQVSEREQRESEKPYFMRPGSQSEIAGMNVTRSSATHIAP